MVLPTFEAVCCMKDGKLYRRVVDLQLDCCKLQLCQSSDRSVLNASDVVVIETYYVETAVVRYSVEDVLDNASASSPRVAVAELVSVVLR